MTAEKTSKSRTMVLALVALAVIAAIVLLPLKEWLGQTVDWVESLGSWGPVALIVIYIVACVVLAPASVLTLGAGAVFGVVQGTIAVFIGATLGSCAAFLVGRYLARDWVSAKVAGNARFAAIDRAVSREGLKIVVLTRLSPAFPFNLLNYAYGLTGVSFRDYAIGSLGMLPGTIMYVYFGSIGHNVAASNNAPATTEESLMFWIGLAATVVVTLFITRIAGRALKASADIEGAEVTPVSADASTVLTQNGEA